MASKKNIQSRYSIYFNDYTLEVNTKGMASVYLTAKKMSIYMVVLFG